MNTVSRIFGSFNSNSNIDESITAPVFEGYNIEDDGDLIALRESYEDQLGIVKAIHEADLNGIALEAQVKTLKQSGASDEEISAQVEDQYVLTEASIKSIWEKIKQFFRTLWGKIKAIFASIIQQFDRLFLNGKKFASKYKNDLASIKSKLSGFTYEMFKYTNLESDVDVPDFSKLEVAEGVVNMSNYDADKIAAAKEALDKAVETYDDYVAQFRAELSGGSGKLTDAEYSEALYAFYRGGAKSKDDRQDVAVNIDNILSALGENRPTGILKKTEDKINKIFQKQLGNIAKAERKFEGASANSSGNFKVGDNENVLPAARDLVLQALRFSGKTTSATQSVVLKKIKAYRTAWGERESVYKAVCVAAFGYARKNK